MPARVILNPYANRWNAQKRIPEVKSALEQFNIDYDFVVTEGQNHGLQLAAQSVKDGYSPIIAAGGDGSISEVVNGIMQAKDDLNLHANQLPPLGILPLGSANDLVKNIKLPVELLEATRVIVNGNVKYIDLGVVNGRYFDNNSAIGLEPFITLIQQGIKYPHGVLRYLLATIIGVMKKPEWDVNIEWDDGHYEGKVTLVTIGNNPMTGGLFFMTPHADPFDGMLTFVYGYMPTRIKIFTLLPHTMKPSEGSYIENPNIHEVNTKNLRIHTLQPSPMHADGEIQDEGGLDFEYKIVPAALPILLPA